MAGGANVRPRAEFLAMHAHFRDMLEVFRAARRASRDARPNLLRAMRQGGPGAFFNAPEIRARSRARQAASAAAQALFMPVAANDAEAAMQEEALTAFEGELGGAPGVRERFSPARRLS